MGGRRRPGARGVLQEADGVGRLPERQRRLDPQLRERFRCGEAISTAFAEATINQVVSKRMVKKQQMRWSPRGAHLLLQVRTRVLDDTLTDFRRWYPGFESAVTVEEPTPSAAAA